MNFGEFVKEKRKSRMLSQKKLAQLAKLSPVYISYLESGKRNPPRKEQLLKLATALNLNEAEKKTMLYLASQRQNSQVISNDVRVIDYIYNNPYALETVLLACDNKITDEDWSFFNKYICNKYLIQNSD